MNGAKRDQTTLSIMDGAKRGMVSFDSALYRCVPIAKAQSDLQRYKTEASGHHLHKHNSFNTYNTAQRRTTKKTWTLLPKRAS